MSKHLRTRNLDQTFISTEVASLLPGLAAKAVRHNNHRLSKDHHGSSVCPECLGPKTWRATRCLTCSRKRAHALHTHGSHILSAPRDEQRHFLHSDTAKAQISRSLQSSRYVHSAGQRREGPPIVRMSKQADGSWAPVEDES